MRERVSFEVTGKDRAECSVAMLATLTAFLGHAQFQLDDLSVTYRPEQEVRTGPLPGAVVSWHADVEYAGEMRQPLHLTSERSESAAP